MHAILAKERINLDKEKQILQDYSKLAGKQLLQNATSTDMLKLQAESKESFNKLETRKP